MRSQLQQVNVNLKRGIEWMTTGRMCFCDICPPSCSSSAASVLSLPALILSVTVCHCLSSSDRGAWIPPPAQRSVLQPLAAAAGHRHPLRGHQTVSSTRALCQQFALGGISTSCLNTTLINDATESSSLVNIWYLALAFFFFSISHAVAQHRLTFTDNGCL